MRKEDEDSRTEPGACVSRGREGTRQGTCAAWQNHALEGRLSPWLGGSGGTEKPSAVRNTRKIIMRPREGRKFPLEPI